MAARPKLANTSSAIRRAERRPLVRSGRLVRKPRELYREACEDDEGNRYSVIVWRPYPGLSQTDYTLDNGTPVKYVDGRQFEIVTTGTLISRCV